MVKKKKQQKATNKIFVKTDFFFLRNLLIGTEI